MKRYPPIVKAITFDDIDDFFNQVLNFKRPTGINLKNYIYRGHAFEEYKLIPTSLREDNQKKIFRMTGGSETEYNKEGSYISLEMSLLKQFYEKSDLQSLEVPEVKYFYKDNSFKMEKINEPILKSMHKLAALAQHYGCYTRLLDWSDDINTAIYFAITGSSEKDFNSSDKYLDIWCLSQEIIRGFNLSKNKRKLHIFRPQYKGNPNLAAQKGVFSLWYPNDLFGAVDKRPLDKILNEVVINENRKDCYENNEPIFYLFKIPKKYIKELYKYLSSISWTASKLFPGYGGVVKEIYEDSLYLH